MNNTQTRHPHVPEDATGIPAAGVSFRATLTATSNTYLADRLPLDGFIRIHERATTGECQFVTFMPDPEEGHHTSFVEVPHAEFSVRTRL